MSDSPWFSFYASRFLTDTLTWEADCVGAYVRLLCVQWEKGRIPIEDDYALARAVGVFPSELDEYREMIAERFPGGVNQMLEQERNTIGNRTRTHRQHNRYHLLSRARSKGRHSDQEWEKLKELHGGRCVSCGAVPVTKDHVVPISRGGSDSIKNIQPLCRPCNSSKGAGPAIDYR